MQSTSAYDGTYCLTVTFEIGSDPNSDQVLVQNRVKQRAGGAAGGSPGAGRGRSAPNRPSILEFVTLSSPDGQVRRAVYVDIMRRSTSSNELARLPGVGNVAGDGAGEYSMRIWLDPQAAAIPTGWCCKI